MKVLNYSLETDSEKEAEKRNYTTMQGTHHEVDGITQEAEIQEYMKKTGCDLLTASAFVLDKKEKRDYELKKQEPGMVEIGGQFYKQSGVEDDSQIKKYQKDNNCNYETAAYQVLG
jgi:hypothetical protein